MRLQKVRQDVRQNRAGDGVLHAEVHELRAAEGAAGVFLVLLLELQDLLGRLQELRAVRRQAERPAADQQHRAEILLELGDLLGERLLGGEEIFRRGGEAALLRDGDVAFQRCEIHICPPRIQ